MIAVFLTNQEQGWLGNRIKYAATWDMLVF
jgi:hypothetical protein